MSPLGTALTALVRVYQWTLAPALGANCRFMPSCSDYAIEAIRCHGAGHGGWLALRRILRCHPWGAWGYDPVPEARTAGGAEHPRSPR